MDDRKHYLSVRGAVIGFESAGTKQSGE